MEAAGGKASEQAGQDGGCEAEEEEEEGDLLEVELGEVEQLRESRVEFSEELKVVELLHHHCIEDDASTLCVEKEQGDAIVWGHLPLSLFHRDRDGNKIGDKQIDKFVMGHQSREVWFKKAQGEPCQGNLHKHRYKE